MKKCPNCNKEFPDSMRFCQTDGTLLVEKADEMPVDPYKTVVGNQSDIAAAIPPVDPFKTMVASPPKKADEDILQLPDEADSMKTMMVSQDDLTAGRNEESSPLDLPPAGQYAPSAPLIEPKPKASSSSTPPMPKAAEPFSTPNSSSPPAEKDDDASGAATAIINKDDVPANPPSPFDSKPFENDFSGKSPYGNQENKPIPSPFDLSMPPGYLPPSMNPFNDQKSTPKNYDEPKQPSYDEPKQSSPFDSPTPFGAADPFSQPLQAAEWTPPPAPDASWQNQEIGANTPFQPPVAAAAGQNQTLAIVSLVCGILSVLCCFSVITGPAALITGFMAKKNAGQNPTQYGGSGLALAGMITGGIGTVIGILVIVLQILGAFAGRF